MPESVTTPLLDMAYEVHGPAEGTAVILLHGFPDDPRAYDDVWPQLAADGYRVYVPWLRGYGETRFRSVETMRSGQQATLGVDLVAFMDALAIEQAHVAGYDWGGRAACILAALWPERAVGLVTCGGYNVQDIANRRPISAAAAYRQWYQWYFNTEAGRLGLQENRRDICRLLWQLWSPNYEFDDATYEAAALSFDNPDFVDVVIHSYRHRHRAAGGDPALDGIEAQLATQPDIGVPTIALQGEVDGPTVVHEDRAARHFTGAYERRILPRVGHFVPREAPDAVVQAIRDLEVARGPA